MKGGDFVSPIPEKQKMKKIPVAGLNGLHKLKIAIFLDVDGTIAGKYQNGRRELRPTALSAIKMLSDHAPVFLWSIVEGNAERLVSEFAELGDYVTGCYGKEDISKIKTFSKAKIFIFMERPHYPGIFRFFELS